MRVKLKERDAKRKKIISERNDWQVETCDYRNIQYLPTL